MPRRKNDIPQLKWRGGTAYIYWYDDGKQRTERISLRTADPVEARQRYAAFLAEGQDILANTRRPAGLTVSQALDDYWREHVAKNVVDKGRAEDAIGHLKAWFKDTLLRDVDIPASRGYAEARRMGVVGGGRRRSNGEGSDSTIRRELVVLNAAAVHAKRWKRIGADELPSIELPAEPRKGALTDDEWLTKDEYRRALEAATGRLRDFIVLAYDSASRRAAVENMTVFQVNLKTGLVNLTSPHEDDNQRGSKKRRPVVPIGAEARPVYERLLTETTTEWLFGTPVAMYRPFRRHMESLGLGHKAHPHILRHSRATHLLQDGVSLWDVAKLLGDTVATVERVYGHACPNHLAQTLVRNAPDVVENCVVLPIAGSEKSTT